MGNNSQKETWNSLATVFNTNKENADPDSVSNVMVSWPPVLERIGLWKNKFETSPPRALDFGCGAGAFAIQLHKFGLNVVGQDPATKMIEIAKSNSPSEIVYTSEELSDFSLEQNFEIISSLMVLHFIEDISIVARQLASSLVQGGFFIFTVFNPEHAREYAQLGEEFFGYEELENSVLSKVKLGDMKVPVYLRSSEQLKKEFESFGFKFIEKELIPYSQEFLSYYQKVRGYSIKVTTPEFLMMSFSKE